MTIITLAQAKAYLRTEVVGGDSAIQSAVDAADGLITDICSRSFAVAGAATARLYTPRGDDTIRIHDCTTVTSVLSGTTTLDTSVYQLEPLNNLTAAGAYRPYNQIRLLYGAWYVYGRKATITVTATWGWASIPAGIIEACKVLTKDILAHQDVKFGLVGIADYGGIRARQATLITDLTTNFARAEKFGLA